MSHSISNRLSKESSPYLREAAEQPVDWYPWCQEAFDRARREGKPILIDIGASWCHWCHVMDNGTYSDKDIAAFINEHFIAIKVDRDERPDIDARYQRAIAAMTGQGGWPLTVFCDDRGNPFYGGTYFPPRPSGGMPGFLDVLKRVLDYYRSAENREEFDRALLNAISPPELTSQDVGRGELLAAFSSVMEEADRINGGFGHYPKFPHAYAIEFLMHMYASGKKDAADVIRRTLDAMQSGGIHDQLGGGFHRYSTDESWIVPHFEKMAYDNAALLLNYTHGYEIFRDEEYRKTASSITGFILSTLYGDAHFYSSQDADAFPGDDGDYWTWTAKEAASVLNEQEFNVIDLYFHLHGMPEMKERQRHVLYRHMPPSDISSKLMLSKERVTEIIENAKSRLLIERQKRPSPAVDRSVYASYTGMLSNALLQYSLTFQDKVARRSAEDAIVAYVRNSFDQEKGFSHSIENKIWGLLDDQVWMLHALLSLYSFKQSSYIVDILRRGMEVLSNYEFRSGVLSDCDRKHGEQNVGFASLEQISIYDTPVMSSNAAASLLFLRSAYMLEWDENTERAKRIVSSLAHQCIAQGPYASSLFLSLKALLEPPSICHIVGSPDDPTFKELWRTAGTIHSPGKELLLIDIESVDADALSPTAANMIELCRNQGKPLAFVCRGRSCSPPVDNAAALLSLLSTETSP